MRPTDPTQGGSSRRAKAPALRSTRSSWSARRCCLPARWRPRRMARPARSCARPVSGQRSTVTTSPARRRRNWPPTGRPARARTRRPRMDHDPAAVDVRLRVAAVGHHDPAGSLVRRAHPHALLLQVIQDVAPHEPGLLPHERAPIRAPADPTAAGSRAPASPAPHNRRAPARSRRAAEVPVRIRIASGLNANKGCLVPAPVAQSCRRGREQTRPSADGASALGRSAHVPA